MTKEDNEYRVSATKVTIRDMMADNIAFTLNELKKDNDKWEFSHTQGAYNYYKLQVRE